ncbi:MAG TPA: RNA polymerase sigma factor [Solirubrobacterales bacterium]|jgi:RNA polymerase sigma factor (sigma-70 family)
MARSGNAGAFETIVDRYQGRLLGFCRQMLGSSEDAEDVLQEVFVNAYRAMLADEREINLRPWLYRIARNRCLNHLRKPTADAQESMDMVPIVEAASTAEKVHNREEFRQLISDVNKLPETQRCALMLREMDAMSYEEIAQAMDTSVPSVKSLLVRARISLAEASQARLLTCGEVRIELAEAAEGLRKVSGPVRRHVRDCEECADFRSQVRSNDKVLAALSPIGPLLALKTLIGSKLGFGGAGASGSAAAGAGASATTTGAGAVGTVGAALGGSGAAGGLSAVGGAIGTKAVAGVVTAAVITAGAVEVKQQVVQPLTSPEASVSSAPSQHAASLAQRHVVFDQLPVTPAVDPASTSTPASASLPTTSEETLSVVGEDGPSNSIGEGEESAMTKPIAPGTVAKSPATTGPGAETVVVTVGGSTNPPAESAPPAESPPPAESAPPSEPSPPPSEPAAGSTAPPSEAGSSSESPAPAE